MNMAERKRFSPFFTGIGLQARVQYGLMQAFLAIVLGWAILAIIGYTVYGYILIAGLAGFAAWWQCRKTWGSQTAAGVGA